MNHDNTVLSDEMLIKSWIASMRLQSCWFAFPKTSKTAIHWQHCFEFSQAVS